MKITGELLKTERLKKNLTVQEAALSLKLSSKIIAAIEAGQVENLPAKTFIRGFVKSYAQYLKLDTDQVMRQFQEEMGSTHPLPKNPPPPPVSENLVQKAVPANEKKIVTDKPSALSEEKNQRSYLYMGAAVVLIILIVVTNKVVDRYKKESVLDPVEIAKVQPLDPNSNNSATTTEVKNVSTDTTVATTTSTPQTPTTNATSTSTSKQTAELDEGVEPSSGKPIEVIIEAKKDFEISYAKGNTKNFSKLKMATRQIQVIRSATGLHLKSDDGGAFNIVVNGVDKGQAGPNNKPLKLTF